MTKERPIDEEEAEPRFLLFADAEPAKADELIAVLAALRPAGFIVGLGWISQLDDLRVIASDHGVALLVQDAANFEADGVHLTDPGRVAEIRKKLDSETHDRLILGVDAGLSRHDAMVAGEDGADYVAFGERGKPLDDAIVELVTWWREVTVMPCLAYAQDSDMVAKLADIGTDFIGIGDMLWNNPCGPLAVTEALNSAVRKN